MGDDYMTLSRRTFNLPGFGSRSGSVRAHETPGADTCCRKPEDTWKLRIWLIRTALATMLNAVNNNSAITSGCLFIDLPRFSSQNWYYEVRDNGAAFRPVLG